MVRLIPKFRFGDDFRNRHTPKENVFFQVHKYLIEK